jgi:site-specific DNA recombinase
VIPANLAAIYRDKLEHLRPALAGPDNTEALEAARALIVRIVVTPLTDPDDPPDVELIGDLANMLRAGGFKSSTTEEATRTGQVLGMFGSSAKEGPGAWPLAGIGAEPRLACLSVLED